MTLHQLPEQNHSQCEYGDPNCKELGPQQRALESFSPRQRLHPSVPHYSAPPALVVNVTELRTGHRVQPASATTHQSASGFRDAPSRLYLPHSLRLLLPLLGLRLRLRLLRILAQVLVIQRGGGHVVMMRTQLDQVSWVGQEGCIEPFAHDTTLRNDVVPLGGLSPAPGDAATTGLLRHPGHDSRRAAWVFNPLQVIGFY